MSNLRASLQRLIPGFLVFFVVAGIGCAQARPTETPVPGKIAFVSDRDGNSEIYTMNADGSNQTRLTVNDSDEFAPAWSPDGARIAFVSDRDGNIEIYTMNADGSNQTRLTTNDSFDGNPSWSPDGARIAFDSNRGGSNGRVFDQIYNMNADGSNQTRLAFNDSNDSAPAWSPDGANIAFYSGPDRNFEIYTINADGSDQNRLTFDKTDDYAPDGCVVPEHRFRPCSDTDPAWSPDSARIAFESSRDGNVEIYTMNADGSNQTRLTTNDAVDSSPAWSP